MNNPYAQVHPHRCTRCRRYSDVCDRCWGTGKRGRVECAKCRGTGAYIRHTEGCVVGGMGDREFSRVGVVQASFGTQDPNSQAVG